MLDRLETRVAALVDRMGEDFPPARRRLYSRYMEAAPRRLAGLRARRHRTIVHGDAHVWNCLLPRDPADGLDHRFVRMNHDVREVARV